MNIREKKRLRMDAMAKGLPDPALAFQNQRGSAKRRGIEWAMTFEEWWEIWKDYYHLRGQGTNGLVMARNGDVGPYVGWNVHLTTNLGNAQEYHRSERGRKAAKQAGCRARARNYENKTVRTYWGKTSFNISRLPDLIKVQPDWEEVNLLEGEEND